jgi:hypothetical protein
MNQDEEYKASQEETKRLLEFYAYYLEHQKKKEVVFSDSPKFADFDYYVWHLRNIDHYLEVKLRRNDLRKYARTKIPLRKHTFAEHIRKAENRTSFFLCGFTDSIGLLDLSQEPDQVQVMVARHDRGEDKDIYALYDVTRFEIIG